MTRSRRPRRWFDRWGIAIVVAIVAVAPAGTIGQRGRADGAGSTLDLIWRGAAQLEKRHSNWCGTLVETRVSPLLARPFVMRGTFCVADKDRFRLDYVDPDPIRIIYNAGVLNVSADGGREVEAVDVATAVKRTREYFGGPNSLQNVQRDFAIQAVSAADRYTLVLSSVAGRISKSVSRIVIDLDKNEFLPTRLEIRGKSGVTSTFDIRVTKLDGTIAPDFFDVRRVKTGRGDGSH